MDGSEKHRFHGLANDSNMRLITTYSHTSTLRGYEASEEMLRQKTSNEERKTTEHSSEWRDRQVRDLSLPQISEGNAGIKEGKRQICKTIEAKQNAKALGSKAEQ